MIHHAALETRRADGETATAFWRLLGFREVDPPETLRERAAWLERGGTQIHLLWKDEPTSPPEGHVAVVVDDYDATLAVCATRATRSRSTPGTGARRGRSRRPPGGTASS